MSQLHNYRATTLHTILCHSSIVLSTVVPGEPASSDAKFSLPPALARYVLGLRMCFPLFLAWDTCSQFDRIAILQQGCKYSTSHCLRASAILLLTLSKCNTASHSGQVTHTHTPEPTKSSSALLCSLCCNLLARRAATQPPSHAACGWQEHAGSKHAVKHLDMVKMR